MNSIEKGKQAEEYTAKYLVEKGFTILCRNFRTPGGEIDIICKKSSCLHVVEVKKIPESWNLTDLRYKITNHKIMHIKKTLSIYLAQNSDYKYDEIVFDVACIQNGIVNYWEGAF